MPGCSRSWLTVSALPCSTLKTPAGSPASFKSSPSRTAADGSRSDGFKITAFPLAMAFAVIHSGTMIGKLNGVMAATTPTGSRTECTSTPSATWLEKSPLRCSMRPQAYSTFSRPRANSPLASAMVLPCSWVMMRGQLVGVLDEELAQGEEHVGALGQ